jgi:hypothetical protein
MKNTCFHGFLAFILRSPIFSNRNKKTAAHLRDAAVTSNYFTSK